MNILFSGGTGFFGKAVLRYLTALDEHVREAVVTHVTVLSRNPERLLDRHPAFSALPWLTFHRGDIEVPESLPRGEDFTHILHAAADSTNVRDLDAWQRYEQITCGTKNLLQFAADRGIRRFLLTSSGGVYGAQPADLDIIPETYHGMPDPLHAANAYGVAKRQAEHLCALYADRFGIEPVIARCFAFVGEDLPLDVHFAIGNFIRDALFRDEITVNGDGSPIRSYMDQAELARWLLVMLRHGEAGRAYNVGGQEPVTLLDAARLVSSVLGNDKPVRVLGQTGSDNPTRNRYVPDLSRAANELRLVNEIDLKEALRRAGHGIRMHPGHSLYR
ncbi:NAD-dependent epimerase/dehydratase family protein [Burkholderia contaminans]|uniref:NAD-dependent epimerase/dehydratase family protein n=1 Tax=Burkholderia contaminans TaxID=488447 RepID=UPI001454ADB5|nr:NAD(P)-dependent oxidoreductase [Burkholderia contaminans]MCA8155715.1 NAD(P)-dependent oxidoreductase [Burkholderia contaminans]VWD23034.1 NAD-dependent dehydratase [Burkholderia contaminans]